MSVKRKKPEKESWFKKLTSFMIFPKGTINFWEYVDVWVRSDYILGKIENLLRREQRVTELQRQTIRNLHELEKSSPRQLTFIPMEFRRPRKSKKKKG